jgi:hypothetical protein
MERQKSPKRQQSRTRIKSLSKKNNETLLSKKSANISFVDKSVKSGTIKSNQLKSIRNLRAEEKMNKTTIGLKRPAWGSPLRKQKTNPALGAKKPNFDHGGTVVSKSRHSTGLLKPTVSSSNKQLLKKAVTPKKTPVTSTRKIPSVTRIPSIQISSKLTDQNEVGQGNWPPQENNFLLSDRSITGERTRKERNDLINKTKSLLEEVKRGFGNEYGKSKERMGHTKRGSGTITDDGPSERLYTSSPGLKRKRPGKSQTAINSYYSSPIRPDKLPTPNTDSMTIKEMESLRGKVNDKLLELNRISTQKELASRNPENEKALKELGTLMDLYRTLETVLTVELKETSRKMSISDRKTSLMPPAKKSEKFYTEDFTNAML